PLMAMLIPQSSPMPRMPNRVALLLLGALVSYTGSAGDRLAVASSEGVIEVDGARLPYRVLGTGPDTIVALAGGPALPMASLAERAGQGGRDHAVILYDARGRGGSVTTAGDSSPVPPARDLADLDRVIQHFQLSRFAILAHHYGALLATS